MSEIRTGSPSDPLTVPEAALRRRSVRHYADEPIPDEVLDRLLELTLAAPSSWNLQPWRIVLVRDPEQRKELRAACYGQPQPEEAPVSFVFAISHSGWRGVMDEVIDIAVSRGAWTPEYVETFRKYAVGSQEGLGDRLREYNTKDALIAATQLALAAESLGLGSSFMNGYDEAKVKAVIGAEEDDDIGVSLVMSVGVPSQRGGDPGRLPRSRTVFDGTITEPWPDV